MFEGVTNNQQYYNQPLMQYAQVKQPSMNQPLTEEEIKTLNKGGGGFNAQLSTEDLLRSVCTHKRNGAFTLLNNGDGTLTCTTCHETFPDMDLDPSFVKETVYNMKGILQAIKTGYIDIPVTAAREFFPIIPLLDKVPALAETAVHNFMQYEQGSAVNTGNAPYSFGALNAIMGTPATQPMYQQPMYQTVPVQQPVYQYQQTAPVYQQPMYQTAPAPAQMNMPVQQPGFAPVNEFGTYGNMAQPVQQTYQPPIGQPQTYQQAPVPQAPQQPVQQPMDNKAIVADVSTFQV